MCVKRRIGTGEHGADVRTHTREGKQYLARTNAGLSHGSDCYSIHDILRRNGFWSSVNVNVRRASRYILNNVSFS